MKIAYIGNFKPEFSTENDVRQAFEALGHNVVKLQEDVVNINQVRQAALSSNMLLITSTWDQALPLDGMLELYKDLAKAGIPSATLHLDTFWSTGRGGRKWWLNPMFFTSHLFTADGDYQNEWELIGRKHTWLPPAVRHTAAHKGNKRKEFECDLAFVGSNGRGYHEDVWTYRKELVDALRLMARKNGWKFKNPGGDDPLISRGEDMNDFYASAKITVGDSLCLKKEKSHYWSDRVPEATGRGGFLIMPLIDEIGSMWKNNIPMYPWGNFAVLEEVITNFMENDSERESLRDAAHSISVKENTYINRAQFIIDTLFND